MGKDGPREPAHKALAAMDGIGREDMMEAAARTKWSPTYMMRIAEAIVAAASPKDLGRIQVMQACVFFFGEHLRLFKKAPGKEALRVGRDGPYFESVSKMLKDCGKGAVPKDLLPPMEGDIPTSVIDLIKGDCVKFALKKREERNKFLLGEGSAWLACRQSGNPFIKRDAVEQQHVLAFGETEKRRFCRIEEEERARRQAASEARRAAREKVALREQQARSRAAQAEASAAGQADGRERKPIEVVTLKRRSVRVPR